MILAKIKEQRINKQKKHHLLEYIVNSRITRLTTTGGSKVALNIWGDRHGRQA